MADSQLEELIRRRAEEIYINSGRMPGRDLENWVHAEVEILREYEEIVHRRAIIVDVNGVQYVGEYSPQSRDDYCPGEFGIGEDLAVRFEDEKMFVKRHNGKELETSIVQKIG
jgi:hypothetical protein